MTTERVARTPGALPRQSRPRLRARAAGHLGGSPMVIDLRSDPDPPAAYDLRSDPDPPEVLDLRSLPDPPHAIGVRHRPGPPHATDDHRPDHESAPGNIPSPAPPSDLADDEAEELLRRLAGLPRHSPSRPGLRHQVVEARLPLVHHLAQRFLGRGEPLDDLVQVGAIGLLNAVDRFDPERGGFAAFAIPTILGEIRRHFRDRSWALRVPRRLQDLGRQVAETREELTHELGRSPTVQELATRLGTDPDLVVEAIDTATVYATVPLPSASEENRFDTLGVLERGLDLVEDRLTLRPLLARLPARERTILALRFVHGMSQSQIASEVGISQMHVSRLLARSLAALREGLTEDT